MKEVQQAPQNVQQSAPVAPIELYEVTESGIDPDPFAILRPGASNAHEALERTKMYLYPIALDAFLRRPESNPLIPLHEYDGGTIEYADRSYSDYDEDGAPVDSSAWIVTCERADLYRKRRAQKNKEAQERAQEFGAGYTAQKKAQE